MRRVSSATANNDIQYNLRLQESKANNLNNQLGSQNRLQQLRDDPLAAGHLVRYQSYATRVEQFEKNVPRINEFYELVYSLFVTEIKSYNEWDGNEKLMIKISDFPIYRDKERNKVLKAYERAHIEKLEGLNMLDEEIERLVKEYRYTSFLEIMKNKVEKSEILQDLIKSKKDNFERKLFAYIMKRIVNENLIYSDAEEDDY